MGKKKEPKSPFAALESLRERLPPSSPDVRREDFPAAPPADGPALARVQLEDRANGPVTVVDGLELPVEVLEEWRLALQRGLAAHGRIEESRLVFAGDHRFKLPDLLLRRGVQRVVHGG